MFGSEALELECSLRGRRASGLIPAQMAREFVLPEYAGHSLANIAATLGHLLQSPLPHCSPPLDAVYWRGLAKGVRRVVPVLLDALGYLQLGQMLDEHPDCVWGSLARRGRLLPMTSIYPSTTATTPATILTGHPPIAHGLLGYELWLREYGV